jgi:hypothetical protein
MPSLKAIAFLDSQEAKDIKQKLQLMVASTLYNTESSFTTNGVQYPDQLMPFADKHLNYLNNHPKVDSNMYLANLRLMTRIR